MKQTELTYQQKIKMLKSYGKVGKTYKHTTATTMANIILGAIKLNMTIALNIVDEVIKTCATYRVGKKTLTPVITNFDCTENIESKIELLQKYVNFEMKKQEQNTLKITTPSI